MSTPEFIFKILEIQNIEEIKKELETFYSTHRSVQVINRKNKDGNSIMVLSDPQEEVVDGVGPLEQYSFVHLDSNYVSKCLPALMQYFADMGLGETERIAYVSTPPYSVNTVHMDQGPEVLALNFPLTDCSQSYTIFLKNNGRLEAFYVDEIINNVAGKRKFMKFVTDNPVELGRYTLNGPVLLNVKMPHGVVNEGSTLRAGISFRFKKDPWNLVKDI